MASLARTALRRTPQPSYVGQLSAIRLMATERANKCVKPGEAIVIDGVPHRISKITQGKRGKGGGYVRAVCRNLLTGGVFDKTYNSDEDVEVADLRKDVAQYTWKDGDMFCFQDTKTFDEVKIDQVSHPPCTAAVLCLVQPKARSQLVRSDALMQWCAN